tara:strand:- start:5 stop:238 length:234 start_codon:yes stop_codon:yes gene_type:complete
MSKLLNTFITKEHLPLKKFRHDVIEILFDKDEVGIYGNDSSTLTDEEIFAKLRILKRTYEDVLEGKDMTHWALQNIS